MTEKQPIKQTMQDIQSLEMMVDYALVESANLKLPLVAYLLKIIQVEITTAKQQIENTSKANRIDPGPRSKTQQ